MGRPETTRSSPWGSFSRESSTDRATSVGLAPTSFPSEDPTMLKKAKSKAGLILASSAELYREMTASAFSLISARR